jgi:hypothetical protein
MRKKVRAVEPRKYAIDLDRAFKRVFDELCKCGLMLDADNSLPSIAGLVIGAPVRGSWWAHPLSNEVYMVSMRVMRHPDVVVLKLLNGKVTHVHRQVWPFLYAVATGHERWQFEGLPASAKTLFAKVRARGSLRVDELRGQRTVKELSDDARALEGRLLVFGDDLHTESGAHVKRVETWDHWAKRIGFNAADPMSPAEGRVQLEKVAAKLGVEMGVNPSLPWSPKRTRRVHPPSR